MRMKSPTLRARRQFNADGTREWTELWGWIDVVPTLEPLKEGPLLPGARHHASNCLCGDCMVAAEQYAAYLKAKALYEANGF